MVFRLTQYLKRREVYIYRIWAKNLAGKPVSTFLFRCIDNVLIITYGFIYFIRRNGSPTIQATRNLELEVLKAEVSAGSFLKNLQLEHLQFASIHRSPSLFVQLMFLDMGTKLHENYINTTARNDVIHKDIPNICFISD